MYENALSCIQPYKAYFDAWISKASKVIFAEKPAIQNLLHDFYSLS